MGGSAYRIVFKGEISEGADINEVKGKIGQSFKIDPAKLDELFSGKRMIVKRNSTLEICEKTKEAFEKAGAICQIEEEKEQIEPKADSPTSPEPPPLPSRQEREQRQVADVKRERKADEKFCSSCGEIIQIKMLSCPYCGTKQKKEGGMGCLAIGAIVVGIGFVGLAIIGILAAIAIPQFAAYRERAYENNIRTELYLLSSAEESYFQAYNRYTNNMSDLEYGVADPEVKIEIVQADENCFRAKGESEKARNILWINCKNEIQTQAKKF
jgi:Tfp pilus assembly protein PilE